MAVRTIGVLPKPISSKAYNAMRKNKKAETTILKLHNALHDALNQARINKLIHANPIDDVERPTPKKKEIVKLDEDEILKLLKALKGTRIYAGVYLYSPYRYASW